MLLHSKGKLKHVYGWQIKPSLNGRHLTKIVMQSTNYEIFGKHSYIEVFSELRLGLQIICVLKFIFVLAEDAECSSANSIFFSFFLIEDIESLV